MITIGIIGPAEIAKRRFLPALKKTYDFEFAGVGMYSIHERFGENITDEMGVQDVIKRERDKMQSLAEEFGGAKYYSYSALIEDHHVDAVYIPLPPGLHYKWADAALNQSKHVLIEKPGTLFLDDALALVEKARRHRLALCENYMFIYHSQLAKIKEIVDSGLIGTVRLYRACFGFPKRDVGDFRYDPVLGGGGIADAGGYAIRLGRYLLGEEASLSTGSVIVEDDIDISGAGTIVNNKGAIFQFAYGMDNNYKCELEIWGSTGTLYTNRIFTAPCDYVPTCKIEKNGSTDIIELPLDDSFYKAIMHFKLCIDDENIRNESYDDFSKQAKMVDDFKKKADI